MVCVEGEDDVWMRTPWSSSPSSGVEWPPACGRNAPSRTGGAADKQKNNLQHGVLFTWKITEISPRKP